MEPSTKLRRKEVVGKRQGDRRVRDEVNSILQELSPCNSTKHAPADDASFNDSSEYCTGSPTSCHKASSSCQIPNSTNDSVSCSRSESSDNEVKFQNFGYDYVGDDDDDVYPLTNFHVQNEVSGEKEHDVVIHSNNVKETSKLIESLNAWSIKNNVTCQAYQEVLGIINNHFGSVLPKDPRTLKKTPRSGSCPLVSIGNGKYYHFGFLDGMIEKLKSGIKLEPFLKAEISKSNEINFCTNVDGLPLFHSSTVQFWPILCSLIETNDVTPFVVGIYCSRNKPEPENIELFLEAFITEVLQLHENGFIFNDVQFRLGLHGPFICDAPAKAFLKCIKSHTGYFGCDKCQTHGVWLGKVTFPEVDAPLRTDDSFLKKLQPKHHKQDSPLLSMGIGMVSQFVVDYMHLVCLGVMRRLLRDIWLRGPLRTRISAQHSIIISENLTKLRVCTPSDFQRKPRSLLEVDRFKATEFRQILLYSGPLILRKILPKVQYDHFMNFHVAIRILVSDLAYNATFIDYAHSLLVAFVKQFPCIYGAEMVVFNVHGLIHLSKDVARYGPLDNFSAFKFENFLGKIKKSIKSPSAPLQQFVNRYQEMRKVEQSTGIKTEDPKPYTLRLAHFDGPLHRNVQGTQFKELKLGNLVLTNEPPNNCILTHNSKVILIRNIIETGNHVKIIGCPFVELNNFFTYPCNSSEIDIYVAHDLGNLNCWDINVVKFKCVSYKYKNDRNLIIPLLHSIHGSQL